MPVCSFRSLLLQENAGVDANADDVFLSRAKKFQHTIGGGGGFSMPFNPIYDRRRRHLGRKMSDRKKPTSCGHVEEREQTADGE